MDDSYPRDGVVEAISRADTALEGAGLIALAELYRDEQPCDDSGGVPRPKRSPCMSRNDVGSGVGELSCGRIAPPGGASIPALNRTPLVPAPNRDKRPHAFDDAEGPRTGEPAISGRGGTGHREDQHPPG